MSVFNNVLLVIATLQLTVVFFSPSRLIYSVICWSFFCVLCALISLIYTIRLMVSVIFYANLSIVFILCAR